MSFLLANLFLVVEFLVVGTNLEMALCYKTSLSVGL